MSYSVEFSKKAILLSGFTVWEFSFFTPDPEVSCAASRSLFILPVTDLFFLVYGQKVIH